MGWSDTGTTASPWYSFRDYLYELTDPFSPTANITRLYVEPRPVKERVIRPILSPSEETSRLPYTLIWVERKALRKAYIKPDRLLNLRLKQHSRGMYRCDRFAGAEYNRKKSQPFGRLKAGHEPAR